VRPEAVKKRSSGGGRAFMTMIPLLGISTHALFGQLLVGLINGSFYAMMSLGLAIIFGLLNVVNFMHGVQYMMGAFAAWLLLNLLGIGYWWALVIAPAAVGLSGIVIERLILKRVYKIDHLYGLVLTFGIALIIEGLFRQEFGAAGLPYVIPPSLQGVQDLGFMFLPTYRGWVIVASTAICFGTWFVIEKTSLGATLRAATENPLLARAFGIDVPRLVMLTYAAGVALAALAGVMAAPIYPVTPQMGSNLIIVVFAVVVIGGMGSILGAIVSGYALGLIEGLTKVFYPQASTTIIFIIMAIVLLIRPAGLFGRAAGVQVNAFSADRRRGEGGDARMLGIVLVAATVIAPYVVYPLFLMKAYCYALFALSFALLAGHAGLLSFGHAAYFGSAAYVAAYALKAWNVTPEVAVILGTAVAATLGLGFGWLAIRRQGIYFAMVTLALAQMIYFVALQAPFTGGEDGLQLLSRGWLLGLIDLDQPLVAYYVVLAVFLGGVFIVRRTIHSPYGQILQAASQNEPRIVSLGYRAERFKLLAFTLSATLAGLAGSMKAVVVKLASLADVHFSLSGEVLLMALIGGVSTLLGPIAGAFILTGLHDYLATTGPWVTIIEGIIFVICVLAFRRGIVSVLGDLFRRRTMRATPG
jgi:branched-chain amino acid transport system permease protein